MKDGITLDAPTSMTRGIVALPFVPENPYQQLLYDALELEGIKLSREVDFTFRWLWTSRHRVQFIHFHWPQCYYTRWNDGPVRSPVSWLKLLRFAAWLLVSRALGYRVIWTIHEVAPHEPTFNALDRAAGIILARFCNVLLAHDMTTIMRARVRFGRAADHVTRVLHGPFDVSYPSGRSRDIMRQELGLRPDVTVFLAFGHIRGYKDFDVLLRAFASVASDAVLVVAGMPVDDRSARMVLDAAAADSRIVARLRYVPTEEVGELHDMSDVAILPRSDGGTSGSLILALSLGKPVVAADIDDYRALAGHGQAGWFFRPGDAVSLAHVMDLAALDSDGRATRAVVARQSVSALSWTVMARSLAEMLR